MRRTRTTRHSRPIRPRPVRRQWPRLSDAPADQVIDLLNAGWDPDSIAELVDSCSLCGSGAIWNGSAICSRCTIAHGLGSYDISADVGASYAEGLLDWSDVVALSR